MPEAAPDLQDWIGRSETSNDLILGRRCRAMAALLDREESFQAGDFLPPLWHWLYFWSVVPQSGLGAEGHGKLGGFLPPVDLPRRMWAGSRIRFPRALLIGSDATRHSTVLDVTEKTGRSGRLVFVTVRHVIEAGGDVCIDEQHDIVYREPPAPGAARPEPEPAPADPPWRREVTPDPVMLFRYSALTFNGHRIHYDADYARDVEGYPGLVVHGPLLATLMVDLARQENPEARIEAFEFRALSPIFDTAPFTVAGAPDEDVEGAAADLWIAGPDGGLAMKGRVELG